MPVFETLGCMASIRLRIIPCMPAGPDRCKNRDPGTYGKHQTKKQNFLVCQQGRIGAEIWTAVLMSFKAWLWVACPL